MANKIVWTKNGRQYIGKIDGSLVFGIAPEIYKGNKIWSIWSVKNRTYINPPGVSTLGLAKNLCEDYIKTEFHITWKKDGKYYVGVYNGITYFHIAPLVYDNHKHWKVHDLKYLGNEDTAPFYLLKQAKEYCVSLLKESL